ncbi:MAG TPA: hypothetical protein V6D25_00195 [Leptolyngbyaceae cyanobacterium]
MGNHTIAYQSIKECDRTYNNLGDRIPELTNYPIPDTFAEGRRSQTLL